jgi:hypothetical protein
LQRAGPTPHASHRRGCGAARRRMIIEEFHSRLTETAHTWSEWSASQHAAASNRGMGPAALWCGCACRAAPRRSREYAAADWPRPCGTRALARTARGHPAPAGPRRQFPVEELRRKQLAAMTTLALAGARSQLVVLAFEELHWADPTSLDLLRALADRGAQAPLLALATTRPVFRPPWACARTIT